MPYPNEHAARIRDPDDFEPDSFRRVERKDGNGKMYMVIMGKLKGQTTMTEQAYRYPMHEWTAAEAKAHAEEHEVKAFEPAGEGGTEASYVDKDVIALGTYTSDDWDEPLEVTAERMDRWISGFNAMDAKGVSVPLLTKHKFSDVEPKEVLGYVTGMRVTDDGRFVARIHANDPAARADMERVGQVSIGLLKNLKDGTGHEYGEAINHVALTPTPVVPNQGPFISIAAERGGAGVVLKRKAAVKEGKDMMDMQAFSRGLRALVTQYADRDPDKLLDLLLEKIDTVDIPNALVAFESGAKALERKASKPVGLDPEVRDLLRDSLSGQLDALVESGRITPDARKDLAGALLGEDRMLTRGDQEKSAANRIISALKKLPAARSASRTGPQTDAPPTKQVYNTYADMMGLAPVGSNAKGG